MSKHSADITLLANNLRTGDSTREICPTCRGGSSQEKSLSITLTEEGLVWQCFRASCPERGGKGGGSTQSTAPVVKPRRIWSGTTHSLPEQVAKRIHEMWGVDSPDTWWWTTDYGGRVAMSMRSPKYTHRGWVLRSITKTDGAKALTFVDEGQEGISWYRTSPHTGTIIVEDIPSAIRASKYMNAVALCGTGIGLERAQEIAEFAPRPVVMALDQDATNLSFKWARKYSLLWGTVVVQPLKKDLKDMEDEDLWTLLKSYSRQQELAS